ncbi:hypothetical protein NL489_30420, partial [Klebsiella pneumoniae]|nr:hypothetical protein [Klebsiella pneumoniae]
VLGALRATTDIAWSGDALAVTGIDARLDDTNLQGEVRLPALAPPALRFALSADAVDLDRYLEPPEVQGEPFELPVAQL